LFLSKVHRSLSFHLSSLSILSMRNVVVRQFFVVIFLCGLADRDIHQGIFEILTGNLMRITYMSRLMVLRYRPIVIYNTRCFDAAELTLFGMLSGH